MVDKWFHGGAPRLKKILPPKETGAASSASYGGAEVCRRDRIYVTKNVDEAKIFAAMYPIDSGHVYEVIPHGEIINDPDYCGTPGDVIECESATVVRRIKVTNKELLKIRKQILADARG